MSLLNLSHLNLFHYELEVDFDQTLAWYEQASTWGCECAHCRNFLELATKRVLPSLLLNALDLLQIPPEKATYVCEIIPKGEGHLYQFSYRIAGTFEKKDPTSQVYPWGGVRCCHEPYPYGAPGFPEPHFDLEFWITLPWILPEQ